MKLIDEIKIRLQLKRFTYEELECIKRFVDEEFKKRNKDLLRHK